MSGNEGPVPPGGEVTIVAHCDQNPSIDGKIVIFLGEEVEFFGTNTATDQTYLFITGPGLDVDGSQIQNRDPGHSPVENGNPDTFKQVSVKSDHTWSWKWDTTNYALDEGTYTIYVVPKPNDKDHLAPVPYGTVSIIIKKSAGSATASPTIPVSSGNGTIAGKGVVTIAAAGDQRYFLGEEIQFSGTNTETYKTYLFLTGPNLPVNGAYIANIDPRHHPCKDNDLSTFKVMDVNGDHTWSWKWGTENYALDAGTYTIYAVSQALTMGSLAEAAYGRVSLIITRPLESAAASPAEPALADIGTSAGKGVVVIVAAGDPNHSLGDKIEFFGTNTASYQTYLFITGPNLAEQGSQIQNPDPGHSAVENDNAASFKQVAVNSNMTWSWKWDTANYALDAGTYTIYAVGKPNDKNHLEKAAYGTTSVILKTPSVTATTAPTPTKSPGCDALSALIGLGAVAFIVVRRH